MVFLHEEIASFPGSPLTGTKLKTEGESLVPIHTRYRGTTTWTRPFPSVFAYSKLSKGLGTRPSMLLAQGQLIGVTYVIAYHEDMVHNAIICLAASQPVFVMAAQLHVVIMFFLFSWSQEVSFFWCCSVILSSGVCWSFFGHANRSLPGLKLLLHGRTQSTTNCTCNCMYVRTPHQSVELSVFIYQRVGRLSMQGCHGHAIYAIL